MPDDPANEIVANWKRIVDQQLTSFGGFVQASEQRAKRGIRFNIRLLTLENDHNLRAWEARLIELLSTYGFNVGLEEGVNTSALSGHYLDEVDFLLVFPLSDDIQIHAVELAKRPDQASRMLVCIPEGEEGKAYSRLLRERYGVATLPLPREKLLQGQQCRFGIDVVRECANRMMNTVTTSLRQMRIQNTVVVLIHGIRTRALWQSEVKQALEQAGLVAIPTNYKKFDVVRFLLPFEWTKRPSIERIIAEIRSIQKRFPDGRIALLAHSFGTFVVGKLLHDNNNRFFRIAFCGSVIPIEFDFASAEGRYSQLINEVGCRDVWPVMASKIGWGYGPTGSFGFNRGNFVEDRRHASFKHSSFLNGTFCKEFWVPYFCDAPMLTGDVSAQPSRLIRVIDFIPGFVTKIIFWGSLFSLVGWAMWSGLAWLLSMLK